MTNNIDLQKYSAFVEAITSETSNNVTELIHRLDDMTSNVDHSTGTYGPVINPALILTAAMGMCGEAGEFSEIIKKAVFHKKPFTAETLAHASKELGDLIWYWVNACRALNLDPNKVIAENVEKLSARYPGGVFNPYHSENRASGDV